GETDAFAASDFPAGRRYDRIVVISRSGTTTEVLNLLRTRPGQGAVTVALTADPTQPISSVADVVVGLEFADERSVVQTLFATTALATLRAHLGDDVDALALAAEAAIAQPLAEAWVSTEQITYLGTGWAYGLAQEAALKAREAAQAWTEAYP